MSGGNHTLNLRLKNTESNLDRWLKHQAEKVLKDIGIEEGHVILDFGCGSGSYSIPAAKIVGKKGKIYALDKDEDALNDLTALSLNYIRCLVLNG
jgi:ribosomal protein L11 methylase PrmA